MGPEDIAIKDPCPADWDAMKAEDTRRYCDECSLHVHDLSAMTEPEARAFLEARSSRSVCVAYLVDDAGTVQFRSPPASRVPFVPVSRLARGAAALVAGALAACAPHAEVEEGIPEPTQVRAHPESPSARAPVIPRVEEDPIPCEAEPVVQTPPASEPRVKRLKGKRVLRRDESKPVRTLGLVDPGF